jgi:hypothetical protein
MEASSASPFLMGSLSTGQGQNSLSSTELRRVADINTAEFMRHLTRSAAGCTVEESDGTVLLAAAHPNPSPYRNAMIRFNNLLPEQEALALAEAFFGSRNRSFVLWVREGEDRELDAIAQDRGLQSLEEAGLPQLARMGSPELGEPGPGVELVDVDDEETREAFVQINANAWGLEGMPFELVRRVLFDPDALKAPNVTAALAYLDGRPASTCMALIHPCDSGSGGEPELVAGGYWGATEPWATKRGLHDLCSRAAFHAAAQLGATVSVCQNSPGAAKNLARMGLERVGSYKRYLVRAP